MEANETPFASATHVAEVATAGVTFNLGTGAWLVAAALQPVARTAWEFAHGVASKHALRAISLGGLERLATVCGAAAERTFLRDVVDYTERPDATCAASAVTRRISASDD